MALTLTVTKEIQPAQIVDLCDLLRGRSSPWLIATESDLDAGTIVVTYFADSSTMAEPRTTTVTFQGVLDAFAALHAKGQLCCETAMVAAGLGAGCADDADRVFHRVTFGASIY